MQAQATLRTQLNITAMYFNGRFDFISFWLSYPTITLIQVLATKNSKGECLWRTCTKGTFLGAIQVCNRLRNVSWADKEVFIQEKWEPFS